MRINFTRELEGPAYPLFALEEIVLWWLLPYWYLRSGKFTFERS